MSRLRIALGALVAACLAIPGTVPQALAAGDSGRYVSGGTAVVRSGGQPVADDGSVVCDNGDGVGTGGVCLAFGGGDAVQVADEVAGENVAFQVCIDNDGDGYCTSPSFGPCADQIFFSHDDAGNFYNPVGPLPTGFATGCAGGPWKGYVVLLCEGVHAGVGTPHSHLATSGTATVTSGGEGSGNFCGGTPVQQSRKPYTVGSGARYVSGGTAVAREDGQPVADDGSVVCNNGNNEGVGGFCTSFGGGDAMAVFDAAAGTDVAFQVCIDNSGDGVCSSPDDSGPCADQIFFSHDDAGNFYNPVGPLPTGFAPGCLGGPWNGYVVFLCEGVHAAGLSPHTHAATTGTGRVTTGGEGVGTFCGGSHSARSDKRYAVDTRIPGLPLNPVVTTTDGECRIRTTGDTTPDGALGGQGVQNGTVELAVAAENHGGTPASTVTASCFIKITASGSESKVLDAGTPGVGFVAASGRLTFTAGPTDEIFVCTHGIVDGNSYVQCEAATRTQTVPQPIVDLLDTVRDAADGGGSDQVRQTDPITCPLLVALAPAVDGLGVPSVAYIDPTTGDAFVRGNLVKDCAPYVS